MTRCGLCGGEAAIGSRRCLDCNAGYMREWRKDRPPLSDEQRKRASARSTLNMAVRRGRVHRGPCSRCGARRAEAHHANGYDRPLDVVWLCRPHHREAHVLARRTAAVS